MLAECKEVEDTWIHSRDWLYNEKLHTRCEHVWRGELEKAAGAGDSDREEAGRDKLTTNMLKDENKVQLDVERKVRE